MLTSETKGGIVQAVTAEDLSAGDPAATIVTPRLHNLEMSFAAAIGTSAWSVPTGMTELLDTTASSMAFQAAYAIDSTNTTVQPVSSNTKSVIIAFEIARGASTPPQNIANFDPMLPFLTR